jgi:hypothetical protein
MREIRTSRTRGPGFVVLFVVSTLACAGSRVAEPIGGPSATLGPGVYFEEGNLVFFAVNAHLARFHLDEDLMPLEIAVANKGLEVLTVGPEAITLRDREGNTWPVASPEESRGESVRSSVDRGLMPVPFDQAVGQRFPAFRNLPSTFGLRGGNRTMSRTVDLPRHTWTASQVWFPNPGGELKGKVFEVWLDAPELPEPVFTTIRFGR